MMIIAIIALITGILIHIGLHRRIQAKGGGIVRVYRTTLMTLVLVILVAAVAGASIPEIVLLVAYCLGLSHFAVAALAGRFWGKVGNGTLGVLYLFLGGYLYSMGQLPYGDAPFRQISNNQPIPFVRDAFPQEWITGLPLGPKPEQVSETLTIPAAIQKMRSSNPEGLDPTMVQWSDLESVLELDSHVRQSLQALKQHQERELSEMLSGLNESSVHGTEMRRNAISRENVEDLLRDGAISKARYQTFLETWSLADRDEKAFRARQSQERFQRLLELLEDKDVTESHRVELIRFMIQRFRQDVRLIQPLIRLYDSLDSDYPRQRRLNQEVLALYLQRREALLEGFGAIGNPCLQPLIDYRRKTISDIHYSQAALDQFLNVRFGIHVRPLYEVAEPVAIRNFINRDKYPHLGKLSGAAYDQDYLRRNLIRIAAENQLPGVNDAPMAQGAESIAQIRDLLTSGRREAVDHLVVHPDPAVRSTLAWVLAEKKDPATVPWVFELMADVHPEVRRMAAIASGNFRLHDSQSARDPKFREIVRMLVNFRTNSDAYSRAFALSSLVNVVDRQKALYVIDLVLNDGTSGHSLLGESAPSWTDESEREAVHGLIAILSSTPDEVYVKTHALKVLMAMDSPDSLGILMHYLRKIYQDTGARPSMLRYIVPHMTLPQEAENTEDVIIDFARRYRDDPDPLQQPLKVLRANLSDFYNHYQSAPFFQALSFLEAFDPDEYREYLNETREHLLLMRVIEYARATWGFWLVLWPFSVLILLGLQYGLGLFVSIGGGAHRPTPNRHANPAADIRNRHQAPAAAIVPVKINRTHG